MATRQTCLPTIVSYRPQGPKTDMLRSQSSLPKLPVPCLQKSLYKYLKAIRPIVSDAEYLRTTDIVEKFGRFGGEGERLQKALEERAKTHDNWVSGYYDLDYIIHVHSMQTLFFLSQVYGKHYNNIFE